jgi:hypothetical protein
LHERGSRRVRIAIKSYGIDSFSFEILEITPPDKAILNELERKYIKEYHTFIDDPECRGYNLIDGGGSFIPSKESIIQDIETRKALYQSGFLVTWNKGLKLTDAQKINYLNVMTVKWENLLEHDWNIIKNYNKTLHG